VVADVGHTRFAPWPVPAAGRTSFAQRREDHDEPRMVAEVPEPKTMPPAGPSGFWDGSWASDLACDLRAIGSAQAAYCPTPSGDLGFGVQVP
jgi:hypothetical protein